MSTTSAGSAETNLPQTGPSAFDDHHPPQRELLDDCVHCGFCLPTCPTYQLWGEEMDSPRGRIYLINLAEKGEIGLEGPLHEHIDRCLGCMACVTACPSGVQYDKLLEAVRPQLERNVRRTPRTGCSARRSSRCSPTSAGCGRRPCPGRCTRSCAPCPRSEGSPRSCRDGSARWSRCCRRCRCATPSRACPSASLPPASGGPPSRCSPAASRTSSSTGSTPRRRGCSPPRAATSSSPGTSSAAAPWSCTPAARTTRWPAPGRRSPGSSSSGSDHVVANVAGCGSSMKDYGHLLADDPEWAERAAAFSASVRDVHEVLADLIADGPRAPRHPVRARVAYHDACHLGARAGRAHPAACRAALDPGAGGRRHPRGRAVLRLGRDLQHGGAGAGRRAGRAEGGEHPVGATGHGGHREPGCLLQIGKHLNPPCRRGRRDGSTETPDRRTLAARPAAAAPGPAARRLDPRGPGPAYRDGSASRAAENVGGRR